MYRWLEIDGLNRFKPATYQRVRLMKAFEVERLKPGGIILGSSCSHIGRRPTHEGWDPAAAPVHSLTFDGATTKEMYFYLRHDELR
jgi:hypothetical protein